MSEVRLLIVDFVDTPRQRFLAGDIEEEDTPSRHYFQIWMVGETIIIDPVCPSGGATRFCRNS